MFIGHDEWVTLVGIAEGKAVGQREGGVYAHMSMHVCQQCIVRGWG